MDYVKLGNTGLTVSRLCFGALTLGPLQANKTPEESSFIIAEALKSGINFIDTAQLYGTYPHIRKAIKLAKITPVISSKSYAYTRQQAVDSVEQARREMDLDVVDIFMMHEQESRLTIRGHREALEYYLEAKQKGIIKAVGISSHNVAAVEAAAEMPEIDVVHPIVNYRGLGIGDGTIDDMLSAVKKCSDAGKGIYAMKPLGGGNFIKEYQKCLSFVMNIPYIHSIAMGMQSVEEVRMNISTFEGRQPGSEVLEKLGKQERHLHIDNWCEGCGKCVIRCKQGALKLENGKAAVDKAKCLVCGYCSSVCPAFAIKVL